MRFALISKFIYTATAGRYVTATVQHASAVIIFNTMTVIVKYYDIIVLLNVRFFFLFFILQNDATRQRYSHIERDRQRSNCITTQTIQR